MLTWSEQNEAILLLNSLSKRFTNAQLANKLGFNYQTTHMWLAGKRTPNKQSLETIRMLADDVLTKDEWMSIFMKSVRPKTYKLENNYSN